MKTLFNPIQPDAPNSLSYQEHRVAPDLHKHIHCFWTLSARENTNELKTLNYRIIPDGCFDLLIDCQSNEGLLASTTSNTYSIVGFNESANFFGIRFRPVAIHYFFPFHLSDFINTIVPGKEIFDNKLAELEDLILAARDLKSCINKSADFLRKQLENNHIPDKRFLNSLETIVESGGNCHIEKEVSEYISSRHLRRMFNQYIGFSPKVFSRIIRFQTNLDFMLKPNKKDYIAPNSNYYDQSHFINEFKKFYGLTPSELLRK